MSRALDTDHFCLLYESEEKTTHQNFQKQSTSFQFEAQYLSLI